ncbi:phosphoenolpyruvate--protein phosphotransferase [Limibacillus sp. MBR-115]|jgi:phosphotransferase system enzyme I (PtsI)|uniref:phosphoenolpyruvate--protein phosphotransferase n=1 Tax=Limibacillus sp. MBR-115 TaxID=3156465 RepID=UPI00339312FD
MRNNRGDRPERDEIVFEGLAASPGVAIGLAHLRESRSLKVVEYLIAKPQVAAEINRFRGAVAKAGRQLMKVRSKASDLHGTAAEELGYLLDAHLQMLDSSRLLSGVTQRIENERRNAESAVWVEIESLATQFEAIDDAYLKSRAAEVREVGNRIIRNLASSDFASFSDLEEGSIILGEEITPADTALMDPKRVGGFATLVGGTEGHTAIMARSLGLPAVLGCTGLLQEACPGDQVIVDGSRGLVILNPSQGRLKDYLRQREAYRAEAVALMKLRHLAAETTDGLRVVLQANLEMPRDAAQAVMAGAEGVGLLRTEFLFMNRDDLPDEEEQYETLREIMEGMGGRPVTVRTLDVGGEKLASAISRRHGESANPALGLRAVRLGLREPELMETQIAAILRASAHGPLRILLPMISAREEVEAVRMVIGRVADRLRAQGRQLPDRLPPLGVMIEVPGAALAADTLAEVSDFFALGTNDLTMYTLAIDRGDERLAHLYNPLHPAVLRLLQFTIEAARRASIPLSVCGEIAGDPRYAPLLLGLGVRELSMASAALPRVKARIRELCLTEAVDCAAAVMRQHDSGIIATLLDGCGANQTEPLLSGKAS